MGRLLILSSGFWKDESINPSGALLQTYYAARIASESGWRVDYITFSRDEKRWGHIVDEEGITVHYLRSRRVDIVNYPVLMSYASRLEYDVVYQRGRSWLTYAAGRLARRRGARFVWASSAQEGLERFKRIYKLWRKDKSFIRKALLTPLALVEDFMIQGGISMADVILVQNTLQKERACQLWKKKSVAVIPNMQPEVDVYPRKEFPVKIAWAGSLVKWKRPWVFVRLAEMLGKSFEFFMMGDGNRVYLKTDENLANFHYLGRVSNEKVNEVMERAWFVVNTSENRREGIPNAVMQGAMRGAVPISMNEDYGFLPPSLVVRSLEEAASLIRSLSRNMEEYTRLSREMFERANRMFGYRTNGRKLLKILSGEFHETACGK